MTCYLRHLGAILAEVGIADTKANRERVHHRIHVHLSKVGDDCPVIWREVKVRLADEASRKGLIAALRDLQ